MAAMRLELLTDKSTVKTKPETQAPTAKFSQRTEAFSGPRALAVNRVSLSTRDEMPPRSSAINEAPANMAGEVPVGARRAIFTSADARSSASGAPILAA